jgi:hypothetical protein
MVRVSAIICLLLLGMQLVPLSAAQPPLGRDSTLIESDGMFLNITAGGFADGNLYWWPKQTAAHPEGGIVSLFKIRGNGTLYFDSTTSFNYYSDNSNIPGGYNDSDCYNDEVFILAWLNDEGEWTDIRQLDFSLFPLFHSEGEFLDDNRQCHNIYEANYIKIRDDGMIGIIFEESHLTIIGYYDFSNGGSTAAELEGRNETTLAEMFYFGNLDTMYGSGEGDDDEEEGCMDSDYTSFDFFGEDRIVFINCESRSAGPLHWMEIGDSGDCTHDDEVCPEYIPIVNGDGERTEPEIITSLQCIDVSCTFTSWGNLDENYSISSSRVFVIASNLLATSILEIPSQTGEFEHMLYDVIIGIDGNFYISGNLEEDLEIPNALNCEFDSVELQTVIGFIISLDSDYNHRWTSCSSLGKVYPSRLAMNDYGDIALIGRYQNFIKWSNYENSATEGGFVLVMDNSSGNVTHVQETGVRVVGGSDDDDWLRKDRIYNAGNGEFWWPYGQMADNDDDGFARVGMDDDSDEITNYRDNCPETANPNQLDSDSDGFGDDCDAFVSDDTQWSDMDGDGFGDSAQGNQPDSCPSVSGTSDEDRNGCSDRDGDGWSDPDEDWTFEDGADQEPDDPQSHVDTTPPTVGFNWQVSDEDDQGGNLSVQITWSNPDWSGLTEANTPDTLQIFASAERWDDCSILQMVLEIKLDSQSEPPTSLLIGNLTNDVEHTVCIAISDINNNKVEKGPEYITPTINQPPEYNGGLTAQNVDYGDSWKIDLCDYFTDEETDCGNMTFTPSTNKISINTQELTAEWVPTASDNILENITISATDGKGSTVESNIFTIEVKVQASGEDVLFTLEVPVMGEVAVTSEQLLGTLGSILAFGGTIGIAVIKLRSTRSKEKLVRRLGDEISNSTYAEELDEMMEEVEDALNKRKISDDQYSTLSIKINSARTRLSTSPSQQHDYNMPMNSAPAMTQHPPSDTTSSPPPYPPMQAPGVATPNVNMRGEFNAEGFETLEYPSGSNNWFYRDQNTGQWMSWE